MTLKDFYKRNAMYFQRTPDTTIKDVDFYFVVWITYHSRLGIIGNVTLRPTSQIQHIDNILIHFLQITFSHSCMFLYHPHVLINLSSTATTIAKSVGDRHFVLLRWYISSFHPALLLMLSPAFFFLFMTWWVFGFRDTASTEWIA